MKNIIAIIFVIIMVLIDNNDYFFKNLNNITNTRFNILNQETNEQYTNFKSNYYNNTVWIYNKIDYSDRKWLHFGSRLSIQDTNILTQLCIDTAKFHLSNNFKIVVFNENDLNNMLPEYITYLKKCKNRYLFDNLVKYCILFKFGGLWINNDTIILTKLDIPYSERNTVNIFSENNQKYINNHGYDDSILLVNSKNLFVKDMIQFIIERLNKFQNTENFNNIVNRYFNSKLNHNNSTYIPLTLQKNVSGQFLDISDLTKTFYNNVINYHQKVFFKLNIDNIAKDIHYNHLLQLDKNTIFNSKMFLTTIINYSFKKNKYLINYSILNNN